MRGARPSRASSSNDAALLQESVCHGLLMCLTQKSGRKNGKSFFEAKRGRRTFVQSMVRVVVLDFTRDFGALPGQSTYEDHAVLCGGAAGSCQGAGESCDDWRAVH